MRHDDSGSGSVWVASTVVLLAMAGVVVTLLLGVVVAHRRASSVADLAAVSGASRLGWPGRQACTVAAVVVRDAGARLVSCDDGRDDLVVTVAVSGGRWLPDVAATARAGSGPVWSGGEDQVEQAQRPGLVQRIVAVPALR